MARAGEVASARNAAASSPSTMNAISRRRGESVATKRQQEYPKVRSRGRRTEDDELLAKNHVPGDQRRARRHDCRDEVGQKAEGERVGTAYYGRGHRPRDARQQGPPLACSSKTSPVSYRRREYLRPTGTAAKHDARFAPQYGRPTTRVLYETLVVGQLPAPVAGLPRGNQYPPATAYTPGRRRLDQEIQALRNIVVRHAPKSHRHSRRRPGCSPSPDPSARYRTCRHC